MNLIFYKYQGAGNDFVMIDNRNSIFPKTDTKLVEKLCDRKFGIGADGLLLIEKSESSDFKMIYYNADGNESTMCGNGGRCIVAFAKQLNIINDQATFEAIDGMHYATITADEINLQMVDIENVQQFENHLFLNSGSPHHVTYCDDVNAIDVFTKGKIIRYGAPYNEEGTNVNFVEQTAANTFKIRTYERGVENETLACGTGATAVAIASFKSGKTQNKKLFIETLGGLLTVSFNENNGKFTNIFLKGAATFVFKGSILIN